MSKRYHGVTSLALMALATVIAAVVMFQTSWVLGVVYLVVCVAASGTVVYAYCAKCPCKARCAHVLPGKAALAFERQPGPYTRTELLALLVAFLLLMGLPQLWLWRYSGLFVAYWSWSAIALVEVRANVCRSCDNVHCPLRPVSGEN
jgi:hypothetical protein